MTEIRDLPIYGNADMGKLKAAKERLDLPFLVRPVKADASTSGRVLAYGVRYPWLGDVAPVGDETSLDGLTAALSYVLGLNDDPRAITILGTLTEVFGFGVKELDSHDLVEENRRKALGRVSFNLKLDEKGDSRDY